jgi:hypothetical protein
MKFAPKQIDFTKPIEMLGGQILLSSGTAADPGLAFDDSSDSGLYLEDGSVCLSVGGVQVLEAAEDGILRFTGNRATKVSVGTTEQRPIPENGMIRYNSDTDTYEIVRDELWDTLVLSSDSRLSNAGQVIVCKNPGAGEFSSVKAAVESIDAEVLSPSSQVQIKVYPGVYVENPFSVPPYVHITGEQADNCQLVAANPDADFIVVKNASSFENLIIYGANGVNGAGMHITGVIDPIPGIDVSYPVSLRNVSFADNMVHLQVHNHNSDLQTSVTASNLSITFVDGNKRGIEVLSDDGKACKLLVNDLNIDSGSEDLTEAVYVSGAGAVCVINGFSVSNSVPNPTPVESYDKYLPIGSGIRLRDGAIGQFFSGAIDSFEKNIWVENAGAAPVLIAQAVSVPGSGSYNLLVEHPLTIGSFNGSALKDKIFVESPSDPNIDSQFNLSFQDPASGDFVNLGGLVLGNSYDNLVDVTEMITQGAPMGIVTGGVMSAGDPFEVNVSAGYGYIDAGGTAAPGHVKRLEWDDTSIALTSESVNFVYFTANGVLSASSTIPAPLEAIVLGRVIMTGDGIGPVIENVPTNARHPTNSMNRMMRQVAGSIYQSGSVVSENATNPRKIDVTPGIYWYGDKRITPQGGTALTIYQVMSGDGFTYSPITVIPNNIYDLNGVSTPLPTGKYVKHALWTVGEGTGESWALSPGQVVFDTVLEAETGVVPTPPATFGNSFALVALLVMQEGVNEIVQIYDARSTFGFKSPTLSASATHGNLLGLEADDHQQYLLANGGRPMAGNLDMDSHNITNVGLINGLDLSTHGSRHNPNGADPLATGAPNSALTPTSQNGAGIANSYARSDHTHQITGFQAESLELTGISNLSTLGLITRTASGTITTRAITGTTDQISITNGNGVSGSPTIGLANNPVVPGSASITLPGGTSALRPSTQAAGMLRWNSTLGGLEFSNGTAWTSVETQKTWSFTGDATGSGNGSIALTLANVATAGTYKSVTVDSKGRVTAGTNPTTLAGYGITDALLATEATATATANKLLRLDANGLLPASVTGNAATATKLAVARTLSFTGDATGSLTFDGSANASAALTLPNTGVIAGSYTRVTVDAKGRVTAGAARTITGTANQITVTNGDQSIGNPTLSLATDPIIPGTGSLTVPLGTTAQRPASPTTGMVRYNSTTDRLELYRAGSWKNIQAYDPGQGVVVQVDAGNIPALTTTGRIPYDTSVPTVSEGTQVFSTSFTPLSSTSMISINMACTVTSNASSVNVVFALFRNSTCIGATVASFSFKASNNMQSVALQVRDLPASTNAVTYSLRVGADAASTTYINTAQTNVLGGMLSNSGWEIKEITQ